MVNIISGMKFTVDNLGIDYSNVFTAFSFASGLVPNTNILKSDPWATQASSGIINNTGSFDNYFGTGFFDGNTFIKLNKNYQLNNSTILLSYEKLRHGNEILLSSVTGNTFNNYSGFYVGINDANKLYLRYWNKIEGLFTFTCSKTLSDKNLIVINRTNSIINLGYFNNNNFQFEIEDFLIFQNNFINNDTLYIGGTPNPIKWGEENLLNFSGYMDRFYIFNNIPFVYVNQLAEGLYSEPTGYAGQFIETCYTSGFLSGSGFSYTGITGIFNSGFESGIINITGYENILSGYSYSGITGYLKDIIGSYVDNCGINIDIFQTIPLSGLIYNEILIKKPLTGIRFITGSISIDLTGVITGIENIYVTGIICNSIFNVTGDIVYRYDNNYLASLSYKEISLLTHVNPNNIEPTENDIIEVYTETYQPKTLEYNKNLTYDNLNDNYFYIDKEFKQNEILMFGNGQALIDSGYQLIPNGYDILRSPNLDYFITGTTIETNKFFGAKDYLFYDYFSGNFSGFKTSKNIFSMSNNTTEYFLFKNGQKLIEFIDYLDFRTGYTIKDKFLGDSAFDNLRTTAFNKNSTVLSLGGMGDNSNVGAVWIYTGSPSDSWSLKQKLTGDSPYDYFGSSLAFNEEGTVLCVGGYFDTQGGNNAGALWIYTGNQNNEWILKDKLLGSYNDLFGFSVSISDDSNVLLVGAPGPGPDITSGKLYIYTGNLDSGWNRAQVITGDNIYKNIGRNVKSNKNGEILITSTFNNLNMGAIYTGNSSIGWKVSQPLTGILQGLTTDTSLSLNADGNIIVIGNIFDNNQRGSVSIFSGNSNTGWNLYQKLSGDSQIGGFGKTVSISANTNTIIVGKPDDSTLLTKGGSVYVYSLNSSSIWECTQILFGDKVNNYYGDKNIFISSDGEVISMSSSLDNTNGLQAGAVLVYNKEEPKIQILNDNEENYYIIKEIQDNFIYSSGNLGSLKLTGFFNHGCSQVYYNGIRQKINNNYIENSKYDLISGTFIEQNKSEVIYNNTDDFFV